MVWSQSMQRCQKVNRLRTSLRLVLCIGLSLIASYPLHAESVSLEALKRMIDDTAHLTEAPSEKGVAPTSESNQADKVSLSSRTSIDSLGPLPSSRRVLLDVRSNHSDGKHDMETLAKLAEKRGIDTLVFGEHDRYTIRLGLDPIAHWVGISQEHPSLYETGLAEWFADLKRTQNLHPDLHIMAATESTPGYHWSGMPFKDLTLHDAERHIIALGVERPEQIEALPSYDLRNIKGNFNLSLAFWFFFVFILVMVLLRRRKRSVALLLTASFIAFLSTWLLQKKVDADVDFINTAKEQGLFTIWTHPGTLSGVRDGPMGVKLDTPPYNKRVFEAPTADAFAAVYGDTDNNTVPGGMWDRFMIDYMMGYRPDPIWAVSAGDYHEEGMAGEYLGNYPMDVWSDDEGSIAVLEALRKGHNTSWFMKKDLNVRMSVLFAEDAKGKRMLPGDVARVDSKLNLYAAIADATPAGVKTSPLPSLNGEWIVDGVIVATALLPADGAVSVTPIELVSGPHVVRLRIPFQKGVRMEANPFLLKVMK